ncbi:hypothetical protein ACLB1O_28030 [Escherichia coli]
MPQRHHQGHKRTPKQLALIIKRCLPMVLTGSGMLCTTANARVVVSTPLCWKPQKVVCKQPICHDFQRNSHNYQELIRLISG